MEEGHHRVVHKDALFNLRWLVDLVFQERRSMRDIGLASFTIEKRIREIGIRKVLGATVQQLLFLISKEFLRLVLIAFVVAVPITWWFMNNWLDKYTYRIHISVWLFGAVGILIMLLTLLVVSLNTMRAAVANPAKSLRTE